MGRLRKRIRHFWRRSRDIQNRKFRAPPTPTWPFQSNPPPVERSFRQKVCPVLISASDRPSNIFLHLKQPLMYGCFLRAGSPPRKKAALGDISFLLIICYFFVRPIEKSIAPLPRSGQYEYLELCMASSYILLPDSVLCVYQYVRCKLQYRL